MRKFRETATETKPNTQNMKKKPIAILREFFGFQPGQTLSGFMEEVKQLTPTDKMELAQLAAKELGCEVDES